LASRTYEFAEFLTRVLRVDLGALGCRRPGRVTYHYACHTRPIGPKADAERLLAQIADLEYAACERTEQCCGFGGAFAVKFPDISEALAREKHAALAAAGAETVVSNEGGCTMHLDGYGRGAGRPLRYKHIAEIIAEGFGLVPGDAAGPGRS
jgi:L-lactate dehydrogenase complex protein LldE